VSKAVVAEIEKDWRPTLAPFQLQQVNKLLRFFLAKLVNQFLDVLDHIKNVRPWLGRKWSNKLRQLGRKWLDGLTFHLHILTDMVEGSISQGQLVVLHEPLLSCTEGCFNAQLSQAFTVTVDMIIPLGVLRIKPLRNYRGFILKGWDFD